MIDNFAQNCPTWILAVLATVSSSKETLSRRLLMDVPGEFGQIGLGATSR